MDLGLRPASTNPARPCVKNKQNPNKKTPKHTHTEKEESTWIQQFNVFMYKTIKFCVYVLLRDWLQGFAHIMEALFHRATSPAPITFYLLWIYIILRGEKGILTFNMEYFKKNIYSLDDFLTSSKF
jgi:hypothetical protein